MQGFQQEAVLGFLGGRLGNLFQHLQVAGHEVGFELLPADAEDALRVEAGPLLGHYRRDHVLLTRHPVAGRNAVDVDVVDFRALGDGLLDEGAVDEVAVAANPAALAVVEVQPASVIGDDHIAHMQPAIGALLGRSFGIAEVLDLERCAVDGLEQQFARLAGRAVVAGFVDDAVAQVGHRLADAADRTDAERIDGQPTFCRTVELQDLHAEALREILPDGLGHACRHHETHRIVGIVRTTRLGIDGRGHAAEQGEAGAAEAAADIPQARLAETL
ncbi:hypothetical protein D3C78_774660 [compost metagenome]